MKNEIRKGKVYLNSPLGLEIIIHYHHSREPIGNEDAPALKEIIDRLIDLEIFYRDGNGKVHANHDATSCYLEKLYKVELPKLNWI